MANYTILMDSMKYLKATSTCKIYQHENLADTLYFVVPMKYNDHDLADFTCTLTIKYPSSTKVDYEILTREEDVYKESYYRYTYPAKSSNLTKEVGDVKLGLKFNHVDTDAGVQYSITTSDITVPISDTSEIYDFSDDSLEKMDALIGKLDARLQYMNEQTKALLQDKVGDLAFDESGTLHVATADKQTLLGDGVNVAVPADEDDEDSREDGIINLQEIYSNVEL